MRKDLLKYLLDEKPVSLVRWTKKDLIFMQEDGYSIVPVETPEETLKLKNYLKSKSKCAQAGYVTNQDRKHICFVVTRDRRNSNNVCSNK